LLASLSEQGRFQELLFEPVLEIADSVMTYRRRHFAQFRLDSLLELLVQDTGNPRSVAFQVRRAAEHASSLPDALNPEGLRRLRQHVAELVSSLDICTPVAADGTLAPHQVQARLSGISSGLLELSDLLTQVYFSHVVPRVN
jgi:uncharacterized alpha-E superfamily protein